MSKEIEELKEYLEYAYSGARLVGTLSDEIRIARAIAALEADVEEDIFTKDFQKKRVLKGTKFERECENNGN